MKLKQGVISALLVGVIALPVGVNLANGHTDKQRDHNGQNTQGYRGGMYGMMHGMHGDYMGKMHEEMTKGLSPELKKEVDNIHRYCIGEEKRDADIDDYKLPPQK